VLSLPGQWEVAIVKADDELSTFRMTLHGTMIQVQKAPPSHIKISADASVRYTLSSALLWDAIRSNHPCPNLYFI
jgi:hypothetical protein